MAVFSNSYSGLITKGLGMPACCGLLTMGFTLFFCQIGPIPPQPPSGGGGGGYAGAPRSFSLNTNNRPPPYRQATIVVKISDKTFKREYPLSEKAAKNAVKAIDIINKTKNRIKVGVNGIQKVVKRVTAVFTRSDK